MDMGSFAGGMGGGLQSGMSQGMMLKKLMTMGQQPAMPQGPELLAGPPEEPMMQQPGIMDMLKRIMMFGGGGQ